MARRLLTPDERKRMEWVFNWCAHHGTGLSDSAGDFLIDIERQMKQDGKLSDNQMDAVERIYARCDDGG